MAGTTEKATALVRANERVTITLTPESVKLIDKMRRFDGGRDSRSTFIERAIHWFAHDIYGSRIMAPKVIQQRKRKNL